MAPHINGTTNEETNETTNEASETTNVEQIQLASRVLRGKEPREKRRILATYANLIENLIGEKNYDTRTKDIIIDYVRVIKNTAHVEQIREARETTMTQESGSISSTRTNLNELVVKPTQFEGYKNRAREWIEEYEDAFQANEWSEAMAIKYLPAFLKGSARDWYQSMVKHKLASIDSWAKMRNIFERHYLGKDELRLLKKQFNELIQGQREPATSFVPRAYKLLKLIQPSIDEQQAVDRILDKMRPELIMGLSLEEIDDIEELVERSTRIEDSCCACAIL